MQISLAELAEIISGQIGGEANTPISGAAPFEHATREEVTYAGTPRFLKRIAETQAGAVIVPQNFQHPSLNLIRVENPQAAFARVLLLFHPPSRPKIGISHRAYHGDNFVCGADPSISGFVAIQDNVTIGDRVTLHPNVVIGNNVTIGNDVLIYPNVTILDGCQIGNRVTVHAGTVIGSDGFGFAPEGKRYIKIPHTGIVQIDDDVEIGAGNTIDRATFGKTWIQQGVKTDNQVHIAHNVTVGENTVLVAQVGIAGSVTIGKHAILAGQAGVAQHVNIGDDAIVGPRAGIGSDLPSGKIVSGAPEMPHRLWLKVQRILPRLPDLKNKVAELERRLKKLEEKLLA
ncbi:UDP-3-O-(3-hydroxymyristoyl)glucosamine N-acyltransferase [Thermodesulfobacteriota bacterium]